MINNDLENKFGINKIKKAVGNPSNIKINNLITLYEDFERFLLREIYENFHYEKYVYLELSEKYYYVKDGYYLSSTEVENLVKEVYLTTDYVSTSYDNVGQSKTKDEEIRQEGMNLFYNIFDVHVEQGLYFYSKLTDKEYEHRKRLYKIEKREGIIKESSDIIDDMDWLTKENKFYLKEMELTAYYYRSGEILNKLTESIFNWTTSEYAAYIKIQDTKGAIVEERGLHSGNIKTMGDKEIYPIAEEDQMIYYIDINIIKDLSYDWINNNLNYCMNKCLGHMLTKNPRMVGFYFGSYSYYSLPVWSDICYDIYNKILEAKVNTIKLPKNEVLND